MLYKFTLFYLLTNYLGTAAATSNTTSIFVCFLFD